MLKRNLVANYLGQIWTAVMGLAFVPLYIRYIGIEAYGLIGLFAVLQAWLALLDMGMSPTLCREIARFTGGGSDAVWIRDLLRSTEVVAIAMAAAIALGIWLASGWLASSWIRSELLQRSTVSNAIALMGVVIAGLLVEGIYRGCLGGFQKQVTLNVVTSITATLRGAGAIGVLAWVSPTIDAFFLWQCVTSVASVLLFGCLTYGNLPASDRRGRFDLASLGAVWRFAGGMLGVTVLGLLLTQTDKILLSRSLPLREYAYYNVAGLVAGALTMLSYPIISAWIPRLCQLHAKDDERAFIDAYHKGAQLLTVVVGVAASIVLCFGSDLLRIWARNPELETQVLPILTPLVLGNLLNALMLLPYQAQLAHRWTGLTVKLNLAAVVCIVPAIFLVVPRYGAVGAAWVWCGLNAGYVLVGAQFMYRRILKAEKIVWYQQDLFAPLIASIAAALMVRLAVPTSDQDFVGTVVRLGLASTLASAAACFAATRLRKDVRNLIVESLDAVALKRRKDAIGG